MKEDRKFYRMNGHTSRLRAKGLNIKAHQKFNGHSWTAVFCSDELSDSDASALALLVGQLGIQPSTEEEYCRISGKKPTEIRTRVRALAPPAVEATHPSVFVMLGRYGDICNVLPMLKQEADAGRRPTLVVAKDFADILDSVSYCDQIVWDGAYDQLTEALRWLRRSHRIVAPVICQVHRHPTDKARLTSSYQTEVWRLAGRLDDFDIGAPLVLDRREKTSYPLPGKPIVLVATLSHSSPFPDEHALMQEIAEALPSHEVVDLASHQMARVTDLLDVYEQAALLISVDTVHLHLARASKVPVIAILNDGWRGSIPPPNAVAEFRYATAHPHRIAAKAREILGDPKREKEPTVIYGTPRVGVVPAAILAVNVFGADERSLRAQATWEAAGFGVIARFNQAGHGARTAKDIGDPRALPYLKDILAAGLAESKSDDDVIVWINDDIALPVGGAAEIMEHFRRNPAIIGATMRRRESDGSHHIGRDLFAFRSGWLADNTDAVPDYIIGAPVFDLGIISLVRKFNGAPAPTTLKNVTEDWGDSDMPPGLAFHESHPSAWSVSNHHRHASVVHNKRVFVEWAKKYAPEMKFTKAGNLQ